MEILFATSNLNKVDEATEILGKSGIGVKHFPFKHTEIRSDSLEEIAKDALAAAYTQCTRPVFVEDTGLFITSLKGFPGTYSGWVQKKIGSEGILRLMNGVEERDAYFEACIAYHDGRTVRTFGGACGGMIADSIRGSSGFGYDPIFIPSGESQTFAENTTLKNRLSHRYKSLLAFSKSLSERH